MYLDYVTNQKLSLYYPYEVSSEKHKKKKNERTKQNYRKNYAKKYRKQKSQHPVFHQQNFCQYFKQRNGGGNFIILSEDNLAGKKNY